MSCPTPKKNAYATYAKVEAARKDVIRRGVDSGLYLRSYLCVCGFYHYGHSGKQWGRAISNAIRVGSKKSEAARRRRTR